MINYDTLINFRHSLVYFVRNSQVLNNISGLIERCFNSSNAFIRIQANKLCEDLEKFFRNTRGDPAISIRYDLQNVDLTTTDWSRHVVSLSKLKKKIDHLHNQKEENLF